MGNLKGGNKTTQKTETGFPEWVESAQKGLLENAQNLANPIIRGESSGVARWNPVQGQALDYAQQMGASAFGPHSTYETQMVQNGGRGYDASTYDAAQITGDAIAEQLNPYLQTVGRQVLGDMRRERTATDAQIGARNASTTAFGGSGAALERAQLNRSHQDSVNDAIAGIMSGGWDRATNVVGQNVAAENAARANNAGATNTARQFNSGQVLNSLIAANSAANSTSDRRQNAINSLSSMGGGLQGYEQALLDDPRNAAAWLSGFVPGIVGTQTSTTKSPTNPLSTMLGIANLF